MKNILTFDIEEWYEVNYPGIDLSTLDTSKSDLEKEVQDILAICERANAKATFFVLGKVAEQKPDLVRLIQSKGHEIASHGYDHKLVYELSPKEFKEDLQKSLSVLESITGKKIIGYRAPSWSIGEEFLKEYYEILESLGLQYSSSVYPAKTFLYGIPNFPSKIHHPEVKGKKMNILEIPVPVTRVLGKIIGFSGGFYFRLFPKFFIERRIQQENKKGNPVFVYLHPREINPAGSRLKLPLKQKCIHYWGVSQTRTKFENILEKFEFGSIQSVLLS
ncbi:polysaccharide deacetylase family protein [Patescibacteria group bacterium]|nr:polysaccharide deacetylase family protein [Patescibacteria group bacterium]